MDPLCNRIKLEHSYALESVFQIIWPKVEDPFNISPDFLQIKNEDDITIKHEVVGDADVNPSVNFDSSSVGQQFENHSHPYNSTMLPSNEESDCNVETKCLQLENNCVVVDEIDPLIPVNYDSLDMVPKRIFLLFQENYEKTIRDLRRENEMLKAEADEFRKENAEVLQGTFPEVSDLDPPFVKPCMSLSPELRRLRNELTAARLRENLLLSRAHMGEQKLEAARKSLKTFEQQCESHAKAKEMYIHQIYKLRDQLHHKQAQSLDVIETVKKEDSELKDLKIQCAAQKSALAKARTDRLTFQKELANSSRIRRILAERSIRLNKKLQIESKSNHKIKLQETRKCLAKWVRHATNLQELLNVEIDKNSYLMKERDYLSRKAETCRRLRVELKKLTIDLNLKELERIQKYEACKAKVCEYCGL